MFKKPAATWLNAALFIIVLGIGYSLTAYMDGRPPAIPFKTEKAGLLPDFPFTDLEGKNHKLHDFKGKIILLNFWATWCAPCVQEFPALLKIAAKNRARIILIALSSDRDDAAIRKFIKKQGQLPSNIIIARDHNDATLKIFGISQLPETIIADRDLNRRHKLVGAEWRPDDLQKIIDSLP